MEMQNVISATNFNSSFN